MDLLTLNHEHEWGNMFTYILNTDFYCALPFTSVHDNAIYLIEVDKEVTSIITVNIFPTAPSRYSHILM